MYVTKAFWRQMDELVATKTIVIDRPRGSAHPRFPEFIMPLDYGYLEGTTAADGGGIDCWCGSLERDRVTGVMVAVDMGKQDAEIKLMIGCTDDEMKRAWETFRKEPQGALLVERGESNDLWLNP